MHTLGDFRSLLGQPLRDPEPTALDAVMAEWGVNPPREFLRMLTAYGDAEISGFVVLFGPKLLAKASGLFGPWLHDWETSKDSVPLLPIEHGMILFGHTIEGDKLCLRPQKDARWTVSVSLRNWFEWRHSDKEFADWLYDALSGESETDWLPEWGPMPHTITQLEADAFGT